MIVEDLTILGAEAHVLVIVLVIVVHGKPLLRLLEVLTLAPAEASEINEYGQADAAKCGQEASVDKDLLFFLFSERVDMRLADLMQRGDFCLLSIVVYVGDGHDAG